ncbi:hypothetical protein BGX27_007092 [Mortierella sp. AM989]|nr:hypothetical protein BGX27_007092 [Mortierella sp. AM989]
MGAYQEFEGIMRFLEESLKFVPPANGENTIQSRLLTIITSLAEKNDRSEKLSEANDQLKTQLEEMSIGPNLTVDKPREPLEAILTRVMQQHEVEVAKLQKELDAAKNHLAQRETTWRNTNEGLEGEIAKLREERNIAEANLKEARVQIEDLSKALNRAEKGKSAMILSRDQKVADLNKLQRKYEDLERINKNKEAVEDDLRKELEDQKRLYEKTRTRSLLTDIEKIKSLTEQLQLMESQFEKIKQANEEKDGYLVDLKAKVWKLQNENNDGLRHLGRLQEELASKDLMLANARSTSAGFESTAKLSARERDAAIQRTKLEINVWKNKLTVANSTADERQKECEFLKASIAALETGATAQNSRVQQELDISRQKDSFIASLQSRLAGADGRIVALELIQASYYKLLKEHQKVQAQNQELEPLRVKVENAESIDTSKLRNLHGFHDRVNRTHVYAAGVSEKTPNNQDVDMKSVDSNQTHSGSQTREELLQLVRQLIEAMESNDQPQHNSNVKSRGSDINVSDKLETQNRGRNAGASEMEQDQNTMTEERSVAHQQREFLQGVISELRKSMEQRIGARTEAEAEVRTKSAEDEELQLDLARALARILSLEELVESLEEEITQLKRVFDDMTAIEEELKGTMQSMHSEMSWRDNKMARLEKDLENRKLDVANKIDELAETRSKLQEQTTRANILEEERQGLKHQIAMLEKLKAEQQEQLDGRERALHRLDDARKTYERMYESKIETLKEERLAVEKIAKTEVSKTEIKYEQERQTVQELTNELTQAKLSYDSNLETWKNDKSVLELERDRLTNKVAELEESLQQATKNVEERNLLLTGYMALVREKEEGGMLEDGSEVLQNLLAQRQLDMNSILELTEEVQKLRVVMRDQYKLMERYDLDMTSLANRNELFIRQGQEREQELIEEKKARFREQTQFKALLIAREETIAALEKELNGEADRWTRSEAGLVKSDSPTTFATIPMTAITPGFAATSNASAPDTTTTVKTEADAVVTVAPQVSSNSSDDMDLDT